MTVGRKLKRNIFIDTDIDCQNCGCWQRVCTWNGECDNLEPMTNEEFLRSTTMEELAGAIYEWYSQGHIEGKNKKLLSSVTRVVEWLKEIHHDGDT